MAGWTKHKGCRGTGILHESRAGKPADSVFTSANMCYFLQAGWQATVVEGDVAMYQRMIRNNFKVELSRKPVLSYLAPIVK